jgi:hypothetical protein
MFNCVQERVCVRACRVFVLFVYLRNIEYIYKWLLSVHESVNAREQKKITPGGMRAR